MTTLICLQLQRKKRSLVYAFGLFAISFFLSGYAELFSLFSYSIISPNEYPGEGWDYPTAVTTTATATSDTGKQPRPRSKVEPENPSAFQSAATKKSVMIIATVPNNEVKFASLWSQLECLGGTIDKIIISSAKNKFEEELSAFVKEVKERMSTIGAKIEVQAQWNDRYDAGLWCDALTEGNAGIYKRSNSTPPVVRLSEYDQFFLINDSIMAIEPLNEVLDTLERKKADLVSLNYWGDKKDFNETYWVESPVRAFSKKGIQVYSDKICNLGPIRWKIDCPYLINNKSYKRRSKRCIVDKTEVSVAKYFPQDKVFGLYNGNDGNRGSWSNNFKYWKMLRDEQSFPFIKNSNKKLIEDARREQPQDLARCTTKYKMAQQNEADPH